MFAWVWHAASSPYTLQNHVKQAIYCGNGVMVNSWETRGETCINGHGIFHDIDLYHFGAVVGYQTNGYNLVYVDPGFGRYSGFIKQGTNTIHNMSNALGGRGYVW